MIGMRTLEMLFVFEMLLVALMIVVVVAGIVYIAIHDRRIRRETAAGLELQTLPLVQHPRN